MTLMKPLGILSIVGGVVLLALAFAVGTSNGTAFAGEETPTADATNGATTGTPDDGGTPATTGTAAVTTPTRSAGGISTPTPTGGGGGAVSTPTAGAVTTAPDTGTGPGDSGTDASLLWLLGAGALVAGAGAVVIGTKQRS